MLNIIAPDSPSSINSHLSPDDEISKTLKDLLSSTSLKNYQRIGIQVALSYLNKGSNQDSFNKCNEYFQCLNSSQGFSSSITKSYKDQLIAIREQSRQVFDSKACNMEKLSLMITEAFIRLIRKMIDQAVQHFKIKKSDCSFIALGSLARKEQTPYSDFEFAILTCEPLSPGEKEKFVKVSEWIHHQIILLEETPLAELGVEGLYDRSTIKKGFALDGPLGMMAPSWNLDLIDTPQNLAEFQKEITFKEKMIFPGELRSVKTIYGNNGLTELYRFYLNRALEEMERQQRALHLLAVDGDRFTASGGKFETSGHVMPVKYELYRALQLRIEGLALFFGLRENNMFEQINKLKAMGLFNKKTANSLKEAASSVLKIRYQSYLTAKYASEEIPVSQIEDLISLCQTCLTAKYASEEIPVSQIEDLISLCQTCLTAKYASEKIPVSQINDFIPLYQILLPLEYFTEKFIYYKDKQSQKNPFENFRSFSQDVTKGIIAGNIGKYAQAIGDIQKALSTNEIETQLKIHIQLRLSRYQSESNQYVDAIKTLDLVKEELEKHDVSLSEPDKSYLVIGEHSNRAACQLAAMNYSDAVASMNAALNHLNKNLDPSYPNYLNVILYANLGSIQCAAQNYTDGKIAFETSLEKQRDFHILHPRYALTLYNMGEASWNLERYFKEPKYLSATAFFKQSLDIARKISGHRDISVARALKGLALCCLSKTQKNLEKHEQALQIYLECQKTSRDELILQYCNVAVAASTISKEKALKNFEVASDLSTEAGPRIRLDFFSLIGKMFFNLKDFKKSTEYYKKCLENWEEYCSKDQIYSLHQGIKLYHNYGMSLEYLAKDSFLLFENNLTLNNQTDPRKIFDAHRQISILYHRAKNQYINEEYLIQGLPIQERDKTFYTSEDLQRVLNKIKEVSYYFNNNCFKQRKPFEFISNLEILSANKTRSHVQIDKTSSQIEENCLPAIRKSK